MASRRGTRRSCVMRSVLVSRQRRWARRFRCLGVVSYRKSPSIHQLQNRLMALSIYSTRSRAYAVFTSRQTTHKEKETEIGSTRKAVKMGSPCSFRFESCPLGFFTLHRDHDVCYRRDLYVGFGHVAQNLPSMLSTFLRRLYRTERGRCSIMPVFWYSSHF